MRRSGRRDRKSTRLNSSHITISYAVFCLKKKKKPRAERHRRRTRLPKLTQQGTAGRTQPKPRHHRERRHTCEADDPTQEQGGDSMAPPSRHRRLTHLRPSDCRPHPPLARVLTPPPPLRNPIPPTPAHLNSRHLARPRRLLTPLYVLFFFFFNDTATTEIYTLSLHDALPIYIQSVSRSSIQRTSSTIRRTSCACVLRCHAKSTSQTRCWRVRWIVFSSCTPTTSRTPRLRRDRKSTRLNSSHITISYAVFCLKK